MMDAYYREDAKLGQSQRGPGRRKYERTRLVYRLVHVEHEGDEGLARCRNISDGGMKLDLSMQVEIGTSIKVAFSEAHVCNGRVAWFRDGQCGVAFDQPIDSEHVLRESSAETRAQGSPGLRLHGELSATLTCDGRRREVQVKEVTQHAITVAHEGEVYTSARLSIALGGDKERHGVVRSSDGEVADVVLFEPFSVGELGSLSALAPKVSSSCNDASFPPSRHMASESPANDEVMVLEPQHASRK